MTQIEINLRSEDFYFRNGFAVIFKDFVLPVLLSLVVFYSCFVGSVSLGYFSIIAICIYLFTCSFNNLIPTMLYLSVFAEVFRVGGLMLYSFTCFTCILRYCIENDNRTRFLFWFILYGVTHILSSALTFANLSPILNMLVLLIVSGSYTENQYRNCTFMFLLGTIITSLLALLKPLSVNMQEILSEDVTEGVTTNLISRYSGLSFDPNFYTIIAFVAIAILLFDRQKKSWISIFFISIILYFGFITFSKSFIIIILFTFILFIIDNQKKKNYKLLIVCGIALIAFPSVLDGIFKVFMLRFNDVSNFNELTTGRDTLWTIYWNIILNSPAYSLLFGHEMIKGLNAAHNTYLEILFRFGIVGCIVDVFFIKKCFTLLNRNWFSIVHFGIIGCLASLLFNLSAYTFPTLWACLFMIFILISRRTSIQKI